jgi:hypothetical protein
MRVKRGYDYEDTCTVSRETMPNYDEKIKSFFEEHIHSDEVRFYFSGLEDRKRRGGGTFRLAKIWEWTSASKFLFSSLPYPHHLFLPPQNRHRRSATALTAPVISTSATDKTVGSA